MKLLLESSKHGSIEVPMYEEEYFQETANPLLSSIYIYNDEKYTFSVPDNQEYVSEFYINDETTEIKRGSGHRNAYFFSEENEKPFLQCFGVVQIKVIISGRAYVSDSISIMVTDNSLNRNVMQMIDYIYEKGEPYLYENYINSVVSRKKKNVTMNDKFDVLDEITEVYEQFYPYFMNSPKTNLVAEESVGAFHRLTSVSPKTIQYIASHPEELYGVDFNTGIKYNKRYFQPRNTLVSSTSYTRNIYENRVITGFLSTVISVLEQAREEIAEVPTYSNVVRKDKYIESKIYIYRLSRKSVNEYITKIDGYIERFQMLYFDYKKILDADDIYIDYPPEYTDTFRLVMPYRAVYSKICKWFYYGGHDFSKSQLLLSFISTSKIYEYYCLIKLLVTIHEEMHCVLIEEKTKRFPYTETKLYSNTRYNNTFVFRNSDGYEITVYFQPVIYGKISTPRPNNIMLYRNRYASIGSCSGNTYTPDYLVKVSRDGVSKYMIIDAKFSYVQTVENDRLLELVYKYLFSVSTLDECDSIEGMIIFCGKEAGNNRIANLHDVSESMNKRVSPFSYIVNLSGTDTGDNKVIKDILLQLLEQ